MPVRVLTISKPYVAAAYRHKLALLARDPRFTIGLICPPAWGSQRFEPDAAPPSYWLQQVPIVLNGRNHFHAYRGLAAAMRAFRPDVVNIEEEHYSLVTWQAFRLARQLGAAPLFYTWQNIGKTYPPPFAWIERRVFREAAAAVCGNHEAAEVLRNKGYRGIIDEIPQMGVNIDLFAPTETSDAARRQAKADVGLSPDHFWIAFLGRLVEEKGVQHLLTALAQLPAAARVVLLGSGPYRAALESQAAALGLGERLHCIATVPSAAVPRYLQAADVLCLPSLTRANWKEQFGRVLVEAMAAEAVVVGSSSGEIPHVIADAGLIFPEGNADALAAAIGQLLASPDLMTTLRRRGAARVRAHYTNELIAARFGALFLHAAAGRPANTR